MSIAGAPWQLKWKRPLWQKVDDTGGEGVPVGHAAAAVLASELGSESSSDVSLVLSVTLMQTSGEEGLADVVVLEVIEQRSSVEQDGARHHSGTNEQTKNPQHVCKSIRTRVLRWPNVDAVSRDIVDEVEDLHHPSSTSQFSCFPGNPLLALFGIGRPRRALLEDVRHEEVISCFSGALSKNPLVAMSPNRTKPRTKSRTKPSGLVAVALVRLPPNEIQSAADAMDIIEFLSLGQNSGGRRYVKEESKEDMNLTDSYTNMVAATTELLLACLSNDGKVHFYSPWSLLKSVDHSDDNVLEEGMASFLFGSSLLSTVQETILPLSQPLQTVSLSVPYLQRQRVDSVTQTKDDECDELNVETTAEQPSSNKKFAKQPFLSIFDASMWDPTLDSATLPFQTKDNVPTHCVAALEYLCIAGCGRKRWKNVVPTGDSDAEVDGGFVTLISLRSFSEKRTLFVPFVPSQISPFQWGGMTFLLVAGQGHAAAIRMDASEVSSLPCDVAPSPSVDTATDQDVPGASNVKAETKANVTVQRFQILPIELPENETPTHTIVGCDVLTSPPGIALLVQDAQRGEVFVVQRILHAVDLVAKEGRKSLFSEYRQPVLEGQMAVITTVHEPGHAAQIEAPCDGLADVWCHLGQGWCLIGASRTAHFLCLEGSNSGRGAFVYELSTDDAHDLAQSIATSVLPVNPFIIPSPQKDREDLGLLFMAPIEKRASISRNDPDSPRRANSDELDYIVIEAMESISRLSFASLGNQSLTSPRKKSSSFTLQEKSQRLLRHCSSWTTLEQSAQLRSRFESQAPAISVRTKSKVHFILSLRKAAVESGPATPFQQVLAWLSEQQDYFTAASLALDLLRDAESLRHLWRAFDKIDSEDERSKLEGLLDGILPIYNDKEDSIDNSVHKSTVTQLADMTVGCLTKGGYDMSSTLEQFLARNSEYDASRASLMLVATAASAVSDDEDLVASVMGRDYHRGDCHSERILWPVQCLLKVGVARDHLVTALLLLNTTIPDELRGRDCGGVTSSSLPPLDMCKSLVSLIVAASHEAAEILLDLVDEQSRLRFWESLEHETRLELSLISISEKHPLLRDQEVRSWGLAELQRCIESEDSASRAKIYGVVPSAWLRALVSACLRNAGCKLDALLRPDLEESKIDPHDEYGIKQHGDEVHHTRKALMPAPGSGGLDFGLLIPALLILEHRDVLWHAGAETSTRSVLNAACFLAGRRNQEEPMFALNIAALMRHCTLVGDVEAGANLVGGKNGLVLECCHILIEERGLNMDEAEDFLLSDTAFVDEVGGPESRPFSIQSCHRTILWLLEEHVLKIRTYGEFGESRGKVDPVFAATICFRTWWAITRNELPVATSWLVMWLRHRLSITENTAASPNRLVCAALVRALIWPERKDGTRETPLANKLQLDGVFLIQLSQACCGLVEALPDYITESNWTMMHSGDTLTKVVSSPFPVTPVASTDRNEILDESFVSAAASFRDLDTSQLSG